jgi:predicted component of type VI protein secretion system
MTEEKLDKLLEQLREELGKTEAVDEKGRELLRILDADIQDLLNRSEGAGDTLLDRLQDAVDHFEITHPTLTTALSQMLNVLNNAGI